MWVSSFASVPNFMLHCRSKQAISLFCLLENLLFNAAPVPSLSSSITGLMASGDVGVRNKLFSIYVVQSFNLLFPTKSLLVFSYFHLLAKFSVSLSLESLVLLLVLLLVLGCWLRAVSKIYYLLQNDIYLLLFGQPLSAKGGGGVPC